MYDGVMMKVYGGRQAQQGYITPYSPPCLVVRGDLCRWNSRSTSYKGFARAVGLLERGIFPSSSSPKTGAPRTRPSL